VILEDEGITYADLHSEQRPDISEKKIRLIDTYHGRFRHTIHRVIHIIEEAEVAQYTALAAVGQHRDSREDLDRPPMVPEVVRRRASCSCLADRLHCI